MPTSEDTTLHRECLETVEPGSNAVFHRHPHSLRQAGLSPQPRLMKKLKRALGQIGLNNVLE